MFVYECIKTDGHHIGMCVDAFMFGSCCAHNLTDGELTRLPSNTEPAILFSQPKPNRPTRPSHPSQSRPVEQAHRPHFMTSSSSTPSPYKPSSSHRPSSTEKLQTFHSSTSHSNTRPFSSQASSSTERLVECTLPFLVSASSMWIFFFCFLCANYSLFILV